MVSGVRSREEAVVRRQANDDSLENTEPVALRGVIGSVIAFALMFLVYQGWITGDQSTTVKEQTEKIIDAILIILPIGMALLARARAYSPKTAAVIAIENAEKPAGASPTLVSPP
jgi:hypothetical protein